MKTTTFLIKILLCIALSTNTLESNSIAPELRDLLDHEFGTVDKEIHISMIEGGLTNTNYKATIGEVSYFIRCSPATNHLLQTSIEQEWNCSNVAAMAALTPKPLLYIPEARVIVSEYVETVNNGSDFTLNQLLDLITTLHHLETPFQTSMSPFDIIEIYMQNALDVGASLPEALIGTVLPYIRDLKSRITLLPFTPCHLDLHHGNILNDGSRLWLVDWEYAAMSDPLFDLATLASTENFSEEVTSEMLRYYLGTPVDAPTAQHYFAMSILADTRWALWCYLQEKISPLDDPFADYGDIYLRQCLKKLELPSEIQ